LSKNILDENEVCCRCGEDPLCPEGGIIYIRAINDNHNWASLPICPKCWNKENPDKRTAEK